MAELVRDWKPRVDSVLQCRIIGKVEYWKLRQSDLNEFYSDIITIYYCPLSH